MPVLDKAVAALAKALDGPGLSFRFESVKLGSKRMSRDEYEARYETAFIKTVEAIDWNRVLLEAEGRHLKLRHDGGGDLSDFVCGECIEAALLTAETYPEWG